MKRTDKPYFISAVCTPLTDTDQLHDEGLDAHLSLQWDAGIDGILVAGTMGLMQLLDDSVYQSLCRRSIEFSRGRGELMIGAGDTSLSRTLHRIEFLNTLKGIDGVVVLAPYFIQFSQAELLAYYRALADASKAPLYLYDLPQRTRSKIELSTVKELSEHPNIKGIKCSDEIGGTRQLIRALDGQLRVIVASPLMVDVLLRSGIHEHLDGVFALAPKWTTAIGSATRAGDWAAAGEYQQKLASLLQILVQYGVFPAATAIHNARGMKGKLGPKPYEMLTTPMLERIAGEPIVRELLAD